MGIKFKGDLFSYLLNIWYAFARESYFSQRVKILKQIFYLWHWNIFGLMFIFPGIYITYRNFKGNVYTSLIASAIIFILPLIWISQIYMNYTTVIERLYFYLAPFAYLIISYSLISPLKDEKSRNLRIKKIFVLILIFLIIFASFSFIIFSISFRQPQYLDKQLEMFTYIKHKIPENYILTGSSSDNEKGTLYDSYRYKNIYPYWGELEPDKFVNLARQRDVNYIYTSTDPKDMPLYVNPNYLDFGDYALKVYTTNHRSIYFVS